MQSAARNFKPTAAQSNLPGRGRYASRLPMDKEGMVFLMRRWERSAVVENGQNGRIILDLNFNRYEIDDLDRLDEDSREKFRRYIYW